MTAHWYGVSTRNRETLCKMVHHIEHTLSTPGFKYVRKFLTLGRLLGRSAIPIPMKTPMGLAMEKQRLDRIKDFRVISDCAIFRPVITKAYKWVQI